MMVKKGLLRVKVSDSVWRGVGLNDIAVDTTSAYDWSDTKLPWSYTNTSVFTQLWPSGVTIVDIQTGSSDFWTNLNNTVNAASGRVVVRLGTGVYSLNKFRMIGASGDPKYSFGFWFPKLQGFLGQGPDKTFIQLDANATTVDTNGTTDRTAAVHTAMSQMNLQDFAPLQRGFARFDGTTASPVLIAGVTFRAADQLPLTSVDSSLSALYTPQPSPHQGVVIYSGSDSIVSYTRFQAAGRGMNSQPPFEMSNLNTQYGNHLWNNCEFDGRRSPVLDPARPRRVGPIMMNNETSHEIRDCWLHHSNISRYAVNDENRETQGQYKVTRCKADHITDNRNVDPAINGGNSLGGYTNASAFGWESINGTITVRDTIVEQANTDPVSGTGEIPLLYQLTSVGSRNPQGGRFYLYGGTHRWPSFPQLNGYVAFRIQQNTYWWTDGWDNTLFIYSKTGARLTPYRVTTAWPPSAAQLTSWGVSPDTHYLIRHA